MMNSKKLVLFLFLALLLGLAAWGSWKNWIRKETYIYHHISLDADNYLLITSKSTEKGQNHIYLERRNVDKGQLWRYELEDYEKTPIYERVFDRHSTLVNNKLSFYNPLAGKILLFDDSNGTLISSREIGISYDPANWTALSDRKNLYVHSWNQKTELQCLSLEDLSLQWTAELPGNGTDLIYPMQSDQWISTHYWDYFEGKKPVLFFNKNSGVTITYHCDVPGFLKDDAYYGGNWENEGLSLYRLDLNTGEEDFLFTLSADPGLELEKKTLGSGFPVLFLYNNSLLYFSIEGSTQKLYAQNLEDGKLQWTLSLPESYFHLNDTWEYILSRSAPEQAIFPFIEYRYLPLLAADYSPDSPVLDVQAHKLLVLDLQEGSIKRESNTFYWPTNWIGHSSMIRQTFRSGDHFLMQLPYLNSDYRKSVFMGINGSSGEMDYCVAIENKSTYGMNLFDQWIPRNIQGNRFMMNNSEQLFLWDMKTGEALNRGAELHPLIDMKDEMEKLYDF